MRAARGISGFVEGVLTVQKDISASMEDVTPPAELQDEFDAYKSGLDSKTELIERAADQLRTGGSRALDSVEGEVRPLQVRLENAARSLGIRACS
jgi:hypothetical protein